MPVELSLGVHERLPESAEAAAYYVLAEALTNTAKHAQASEVDVRVDADDATEACIRTTGGIGGSVRHPPRPRRVPVGVRHRRRVEVADRAPHCTLIRSARDDGHPPVKDAANTVNRIVYRTVEPDSDAA